MNAETTKFSLRTIASALIAAGTSTLAWAQGFPAPEELTECRQALTVASQADGKLEARDVAVYESRAVELCLTQLGEDNSATLASMLGLANTYRNLGRYDQALVLYEKTLPLLRAKIGEDHPVTLDSMNKLAVTYGDLGRHDQALTLKEKVLALGRAKLGEDHSDTLASMHNLAVTYLDLGRHDQARALFEKTLALQRANLGEDHPAVFSGMHNLANTYLSLGLHDQALVLFEKTLVLRRAKLGEDHPHTLNSMDSLANTYRILGRHEQALALFKKSLALLQVKVGENHPDTLISMNNLALTFGDLGRHNEALALLEKTLALRRAKLGEDHPATLSSMHNLAVIYSDLGRHNQALALIPPIFSGIEALRAQPGLTTDLRQSVFTDYSDRYQRYAHWYATAQRLTEGFDIGDLSKARTLTDSIRGQSALRALPETDQRRVQASEAQVRQMQGQLDVLAQSGTRDTTTLLAVQQKLVAHAAQHRELVTNLERRFPKYIQLRSLKPATVKDAPRFLAAGEALVSYLVDREGRAQVFVLDARGQPRWADLGRINNLAHSVAASRELISSSDRRSVQGTLVALKDGGYQWLLPGQPQPKDTRLVANNPAEARIVLDRYWHDTLVKPVLPLAGTNARWIISPDKDLALLPFDTLPEALSDTGAVLKTLSETRNLSLVQSFAVYALLKQREAEYAGLARPKALMAMGNAVYGPGWTESRGMNRASGERGFAPRNASVTEGGTSTTAPLGAPAEQYALTKGGWKNLPGTAQEIKAVSAVFADNAKGGGGVDRYQGLDASEGQLQKLNEGGRLKDYHYLLFSAHGYLAQNSALSSLVLSQQGNPPKIDGYVTAEEWPFYDIKSDLTVLSACDTGVGKTLAGESVMGLPYALFVAGNKNTLLSLWPVDDEATAEFMRRFFTKLKAGTPQPDALTQTKREFMQHPKWSAPRYWAAFVLYGV